MKFIVFVIAGGNSLATSDEMVKINEFNDKLQSKNYWVTAAGIAGATDSLLIDNRNNKDEVQRGSLVKTEENYSGYWIVDVESEEIAKELALEGSFACNRKVELRPYLR